MINQGGNSLVDQQRDLGHLGQAGLAQAQCRQWYVPPVPPRPMTLADLGIVDQNLDDKIGMDL